MVNIKKFVDPVRVNACFERKDKEYIDEYCFAHGISITQFIVDCVKSRIAEIELNEKLKK